MYLRLARQSGACGLPPDFPLRASQLALRHLNGPFVQSAAAIAVHRTWVSPIGSPFGSAVLELTRQLLLAAGTPKAMSLPLADLEDDRARWKGALDTLTVHVRASLDPDSVVESEVLYGRAGLLWALLNLSEMIADVGRGDEAKLAELADLCHGATIQRLAELLVALGRQGSKRFAQTFNEEPPLPLLWGWHGKFYLGAIHGAGQ
jgi:hypothetical protein